MPYFWWVMPKQLYFWQVPKIKLHFWWFDVYPTLALVLTGASA